MIPEASVPPKKNQTPVLHNPNSPFMLGASVATIYLVDYERLPAGHQFLRRQLNMNVGIKQSIDQLEWADAKRDELYKMLCCINLNGERYLELATILSTFSGADSSLASKSIDQAPSQHRGLRLVTAANG